MSALMDELRALLRERKSVDPKGTPNQARKWMDRAAEALTTLQSRLEAVEAERDAAALETHAPIGNVYGLLLWHHMDAARKANEPLRERVFQAIETLREVWPVETQAWEDQFPPRSPARTEEGKQ
jgi:hypothetical protein